MHEVISSQVERTPDAVAVQVGDTTLTYRQLDDRAAAIASRLVQAGAGTGAVVAVLLDRTPDLVAAVLGILKSGAAFLPLDPRQPAARNTFCINDAGANIVLTDHQLPTGGEAVTATVVNLDDCGGARTSQFAPSIAVSAADLAYVIYTSGSTGRPKGVLIEHRSVTNLMQTMFREFGVAASDTVLSVASISFDVALGDIFCALACGARLVLATAAQATNPAALIRLIADSGATYMMATPTTWGALVAAGWRGNRRLTAASDRRDAHRRAGRGAAATVRSGLEHLRPHRDHRHHQRRAAGRGRHRHGGQTVAERADVRHRPPRATPTGRRPRGNRHRRRRSGSWLPQSP